MQKAALEINPATVGRWALGGTLVGAGSASVIALIHMLKQMREERKRQEAARTDENTIVLTLPKRAEVEAGDDEPSSDKRTKEGPEMRLTKGPRTSSNFRRVMDGTFGPKTAAVTGWPTLTAATLAGIAGTAAGSALVMKLYEAQREKQLKRQLEAARQEYASALTSGNADVKESEFVESMFDQELLKQADSSRTFGFLNYPMAVAALTYVLGTGGVAYLTKRILEEKNIEAERKGLDIPKAKRIVIRSAPETDPTKMASAEDVECIQAALAVMMDKVSGTELVLSTPYVKEAATKANITPGELLKLADDLSAFHEQLMQPQYGDLRQSLYRAMMEQHPIMSKFRWAFKVPGLRRIAMMMGDRSLNNRFNQMAQPARPQFAGDSKVAQIVPGLNKLLFSDILGSSISNAVLGNKPSGTDPKAIAQAIIEAQQEAQTAEQEDAQDPQAEDITIEPQGRQAEDYVAANRDRIEDAVAHLKQEGRL